jgi:hypothetical protein
MVPAGRVVVVMTGADVIASANGWGGDVVPALSLTVTLKLNGLPAALLGVPLIVPVEVLRVRPGGKDPMVTVHELYGVAPPVADNVCE